MGSDNRSPIACTTGQSQIQVRNPFVRAHCVGFVTNCGLDEIPSHNIETMVESIVCWYSRWETESFRWVSEGWCEMVFVHFVHPRSDLWQGVRPSRLRALREIPKQVQVAGNAPFWLFFLLPFTDQLPISAGIWAGQGARSLRRSSA